jgi:peptidyl-tRNA hydrolase, PTH1 family
MIVFYGLGNNDPKYLNTKHNAGRLVVEGLAKSWEISFSKGTSYFYTKSKDNLEICLLYSAGYMNNSGLALGDFLRYFKLDFKPTDSLLIIQDDSDQQNGKQKLLRGGGSAGHHGINDIYRHLPGLKISLEQVWRLKIGIRPDGNRERSETFVLTPASASELQHYQLISNLLAQNINKIESDGLIAVQEILNRQ